MISLLSKSTHIGIGIPVLVILLLGLGWENTSARPTSLQGQEYAITDKDISFAIKARFVVDPRVPDHSIDIETRDGIVMLSGRVKTLLAKDRAAKLVESVRGVQAVINRIQVVPSPNVDDEELRERVQEALAKDPATESYEVQVSSYQGAVRLKGTVNSWQEKQLSGQVAKSVKGVVRLVNRLTVRPAAKRTDSEIEAEVIRRLQADVWVDGKFIGVMVDRGRVTLTGSVGSLAEKYAAFTDAWVSGVIAVNVKPLQVEWWERDRMRRNPGELFRTNEQIQDSLYMAWKYDPRVDFSSIEMEVERGIVTLTGVVTNMRAKRAAEQDAKNTTGVFQVRNFLRVRPAQSISDEQLKGLVRKVFYDTKIDPYEIKISVQRGKVFLDGYVDSSFEMAQAVQAVEQVRAVRDVVNRLKVDNLSNRKGMKPSGGISCSPSGGIPACTRKTFMFKSRMVK